MNKKGFTLIELVMVIIIIGIIGVITIPSILESLSKSREDSGKNIEEILKSNLEMYNLDNENDFWCDFDDFKTSDYLDASGNLIEGILPDYCEEQYSSPTKLGVTFDELSLRNPDIDLGECLLNANITGAKDINGGSGPFAFAITRQKGAESNYNYDVSIICSKSFKGLGKHYVSELQGNELNYYAYYQTK